MAAVNYVAHRPKRHAVYNAELQKWVFAKFGEVAPIGAREYQYLQLLSKGHSNSHIAELMGVTSKTAYSFSRDLQHKFRVEGERKLLVLAIDMFSRNQNRIRQRSSNQEKASVSGEP